MSEENTPAQNRAVQVEVRSNYGAPAVYPACGTARIFARLTGKRTFSRRDLDAIRELGYEITMAQDSLRLPDGYGHAAVV